MHLHAHACTHMKCMRVTRAQADMKHEAELRGKLLKETQV